MLFFALEIKFSMSLISEGGAGTLEEGRYQRKEMNSLSH